MNKTRQEILEEKKQQIMNDYNWNEDDDADKIKKALKKEQDLYDAVQGKKHFRNEVELLKKGKEFYKAKSADKPNKGNDPKGEKSLISPDEKSYLYGKLGMNRTEVRHLEKVMKSIETDSWEKAIKDNLFKTWKKDNDALIIRRGSGLPASRGGSSPSENAEHDKIVEKFSQDLPKGFSAKKSK